ncbi:MAG: chemotaxis protein CheW [Bilophila sp.]
MTPLLRLRDILELPAPKSGEGDRFTIVCRCRGLQVGLQVDSVHNMYRVDQKDIQWNVEVKLGFNGESVSGLFKLEDKLIPIVSVERIVDRMLQE